MSFEPYWGGLAIMRDSQTAKPQTIVTGDGWFVYNLATNIRAIAFSKTMEAGELDSIRTQRQPP